MIGSTKPDTERPLRPEDIPPPCYIQEGPDQPADEALAMIGAGLLLLGLSGAVTLLGLLYLLWTS